MYGTQLKASVLAKHMHWAAAREKIVLACMGVYSQQAQLAYILS